MKLGATNVIEVNRGAFLDLFERDRVVATWNECQTPLKIVARQIVLEDGTIVQLKV